MSILKPYREGRRVIIECASEMEADMALAGILAGFDNEKVEEAVREVLGQQVIDDALKDVKEKWEIVDG